MKLKSIITVSAVLALTACSKPYDYTGSYEATKGDSCEVQPGDNTLITISPAIEGENTYTARLSSQMSGGGVFPVESKPSKVAEDGSLTFMFFKEGKSGLFSGKPAVDMKIKLIDKDDAYIYLQSWPVTVSAPNNPALGGSFDFVKDPEISMMGRKAPNELSKQAGKNGLCLKKSSV
ncbi:hypothetical protein [Lacimicrobium sp. SS2-24]|uniref:hypothetical protein n=1 Tax=Lacimicrobium sp. SS2-24 TaxID=2005569 RepID=UPI0011305487|nr:hypothetical protein [Lacimicrobium sp. SS2-24]